MARLPVTARNATLGVEKVPASGGGVTDSGGGSVSSMAEKLVI
jgi:hypothetical protein